MRLERLKGRKSQALGDLANEALVVELKDGKTYGGQLDEYFYDYGGTIHLYHCRILDAKNHKWVEHDTGSQYERRLVADDMHFRLADVREIFLLSEKQRDERLDLDDVLQIYIDPYYRPLKGIICHWEPGVNWETKERHSVECDARLHEALVFLKTCAHLGAFDTKNKEKNMRKFNEGFYYARRRLLMSGARIP